MCDQQSLRPACAYAQSDQSLCLSLEYSMIVKLLTERHLEFLSLKGCCTGSSESTLVKMSNCWKSRALAHIIWLVYCWENLYYISCNLQYIINSWAAHCVNLSLLCVICRYCLDVSVANSVEPDQTTPYQGPHCIAACQK